MNSIVSSAINNLKELEKTMRLEEEAFKIDDIDNCDRLADQLNDLENQIKQLYDDLESETIRQSVIRDKLTRFPFELKRELESYAKAARDSNAAVIKELTDKLDKLTKKNALLLEKNKKLTEEIERMKPERDELLIKYDFIIGFLNENMSSKAEIQITLNESRDFLRETNQITLDLEDEILDIKEQLAKEKAEFRVEKKILYDEINGIDAKAGRKEDKNFIKEKELGNLKINLDRQKDNLAQIIERNSQMDSNIEAISNEIQKNKDLLQETIKAFDDSNIESLRLTNLEVRTKQDFADKKEEAIRKTKELTTQTHLEIDRLKKLKDKHESKQEELKKILKRYQDVEEMLEHAKKSIDEIKAEIGIKLQEIAEMESRTRAVYADLELAKDSHAMIIESLQREAEKLREQLIHEREKRSGLQKMKDEKVKEIDAFNQTVIEEQAKATRYLAEGKAKYNELLAKEKELNENIAKNEALKEQLIVKLETAVSNYNEMKSSLETRIKQLEDDIVLYTSKNEMNKKEISDLTPGYDELCAAYDKKKKEFHQMIKNVSELKQKKANFEKEITETKLTAVEHTISSEDLRQKIKEKQQESLETMKDRNKDLKELEFLILNSGIHNENIKNENNKFKIAIQTFENDFEDIEKFKKEIELNKDVYEEEYKRIHRNCSYSKFNFKVFQFKNYNFILDKLLQGWKSDKEIEALFDQKDSRLIKNLSDFLRRTKTREAGLDRVNTKLNGEIYDIDSYLNKLIGDNSSISGNDNDNDNGKNKEFNNLNTNDIQIQIENN
jgi:chromosome segregation ATPase